MLDVKGTLTLIWSEARWSSRKGLGELLWQCLPLAWLRTPLFHNAGNWINPAQTKYKVHILLPQSGREQHSEVKSHILQQSSPELRLDHCSRWWCMAGKLRQIDSTYEISICPNEMACSKTVTEQIWCTNTGQNSMCHQPRQTQRNTSSISNNNSNIPDITRLQVQQPCSIRDIPMIRRMRKHNQSLNHPKTQPPKPPPPRFMGRALPLNLCCTKLFVITSHDGAGQTLRGSSCMWQGHSSIQFVLGKTGWLLRWAGCCHEMISC